MTLAAEQIMNEIQRLPMEELREICQRLGRLVVETPASTASEAEFDAALDEVTSCAPQWRYVLHMANGETTALERLLRPRSQHFPVELARALVAVQTDAETQARYDNLAGKHTEGQLTLTEQAELEFIVRTNTLLGVLKAD